MNSRERILEALNHRMTDRVPLDLGSNSQTGMQVSTVVWVSGTDFGAQKGPLISPRQYRTLFMPVQKRINDWIHAHTTWKTFIHSCGSILPLVPDMIEAGGGYVFNTIHNVQHGVPVENLLAMYETVRDYRPL